MLQLSALPTVPGTASMAEILGNGGADAGESTNFGALLAVRIGTEPALPAPATAAIPSPALPDTGKILPPVQSEVMAEVLPVALPLTLARAVPARVNAAADSESGPAPVAGPETKTPKLTPLTLPCTVVAKARATPALRPDPAVDTAPEDQAAEQPPVTFASTALAPLHPAAHSAIPPVLVQAELVVLPNLDDFDSLPPSPLGRGRGWGSEVDSPRLDAGVERPPQPLPIGEGLYRFRSSRSGISATVPPLTEPVFAPAVLTEAAARPFTQQFDQPVDQPPVRTLPANGSALAPLPSSLLAIAALPALPITVAAAAHLADPLTRAPTNLRIREDSADITAPITLTGKPGDGPALVYELLHGKAGLLREVPQIREGMASALTEAQPAGPISTTPAIAPVRPLDFAALVDRLVMARDAAAPQIVSLALTHAEFGKISLRFEQDDTGLNVGMTSPDPDFALAVSAAMPPERAGLAEQHQGGQSSRHDASGSDLPGQSRGGSNPERRDERGAPRPDPAQTARHRADKQGRGEIFA